MSLLMHEPDVQPEPPIARRKLRRRRRWLAVGLLGPVAAVGVFYGVRSAVSAFVDEPPRLFDRTVGDGGFTYDKGYPVGTTFHFDLSYGELPAVQLVDVRPIVREGSAPAALSVNACSLFPPNYPLMFGVDELSTACDGVRPADGLDLTPLGEHDVLVLTVVPLAEGSVEVTGVDISYFHEGRTWTERYDLSIALEV